MKCAAPLASWEKKLVCCWEKQCMPQRYIQSSDVTPELHEPSIHKTLNFFGKRSHRLDAMKTTAPEVSG